jgi:hypothetical protein
VKKTFFASRDHLHATWEEIMIRVPVYSLALGAIGFVIGAVMGNEAVSMFLGGAGSLIGYGVWLRARLSAIRYSGKAFHLGSVLNVIVCTTIAVGFGIALVIREEIVDANIFWFIMLVINALAVWLHWKAALRAGTLRWFPTGREVGEELIHTVTAEEPAIAALRAVGEVGSDAFKEAWRMGQHLKNNAPVGREAK